MVTSPLTVLMISMQRVVGCWENWGEEGDRSFARDKDADETESEIWLKDPSGRSVRRLSHATRRPSHDAFQNASSRVLHSRRLKWNLSFVIEALALSSGSVSAQLRLVSVQGACRDSCVNGVHNHTKKQAQKKTQPPEHKGSTGQVRKG